MKSVFVLMPFTAEFDRIYQKLIVPPFEDSGFSVFRADTLSNQQNILRDIVSGIATSDLVVADLTGINANVMYELGIAHALDKRVVMLTQALETVPFDLRAYRIIKYSVSFDQADDLSTELKNIASKLKTGHISFGNPVSDFIGSRLNVIASESVEQVQPDDRTLIDLLLLANGASEKFNDALLSIEPTLDELVKSVQGHLEESARRRLVGNRARHSVAEMANFGKLIAQEFDKATSSLSQVPREIGKAIDELEDVSLAMFSTEFMELTLGPDNLATTRTTFAQLDSASQGGTAMIQSVLEQIHPLRKISKELNRALKSNMEWWNELKIQFERVSSISNRVIEIVDSQESPASNH